MRLLILVAALMMPATALAEGPTKLKPGGLGPLRVGMTEQQVEALVGRKITQDKLGGSCGTATLTKRDYLLFTNDRLRRVTVNSKLYTTRKGVGVGSPQSAIRDAYGAKAKRSQHVYDPEGFYFSVSYGRLHLRFETDGKKVTAMHGGRTPEVDYVEGCA